MHHLLHDLAVLQGNSTKGRSPSLASCDLPSWTPLPLLALESLLPLTVVSCFACFASVSCTGLSSSGFLCVETNQGQRDGKGRQDWTLGHTAVFKHTHTPLSRVHSANHGTKKSANHQNAWCNTQYHKTTSWTHVTTGPPKAQRIHSHRTLQHPSNRSSQAPRPSDIDAWPYSICRWLTQYSLEIYSFMTGWRTEKKT